MKKLVVLGAGESGIGVAKLAAKKGWQVLVSDKGTISKENKEVLINIGVKFEEDKHSETEILQADSVVKSPGIPDHIPLIKSLKQKGIEVISEIEFAARYTNAKLIGITGSNGKTTTASLCYHILKNANYNVALVGNIGKSFAGSIAEKEHEYYVIELSSFQLDGMFKTRLHVAILMNITEDHLDRYEYKFQNYINSKFRIIQNQTEEDAFVFCSDDEVITKELLTNESKAVQFPFSLTKPQKKGAEIISNHININVHQTVLTMSIQNLALQGKHNIYNSMASGITGRILDIRKEVIRDSLTDFQSLEHRLEHVVTVSGIDYINDSKATNINSTWFALETMQSSIVWIVGGVDKGNDYSTLLPIVKQKVKTIICLGLDNEKIKEAFGDVVDTIIESKSMSEAVAYAYQSASKGESVLLSPACASFDLFDNYEDRGRQFKESVRSL
jgi:UDP-N-acetylmuramoylalanine--D-glutamate ligase